MPIYEYLCQDCGSEFEDLVFGEEQPVCPRCESARAEKKLSAFSTPSAEAPRPAVGPCGSCPEANGPGACSMN